MQPTRTGKDNNALLSCHLLKSLKGDVTGDDSQRPFFAQRGIGMLEQCCNAVLPQKIVVAKSRLASSVSL